MVCDSLLVEISNTQPVTETRKKMSTTLITNVNVFDGMNETLIEKANVLVEGNKIKAISTEKPEGGLCSPDSLR